MPINYRIAPPVAIRLFAHFLLTRATLRGPGIGKRLLRFHLKPKEEVLAVRRIKRLREGPYGVCRREEIAHITPIDEVGGDLHLVSKAGQETVKGWLGACNVLEYANRWPQAVGQGGPWLGRVSIPCGSAPAGGVRRVVNGEVGRARKECQRPERHGRVAQEIGPG